VELNVIKLSKKDISGLIFTSLRAAFSRDCRKRTRAWRAALPRRNDDRSKGKRTLDYHETIVPKYQKPLDCRAAKRRSSQRRGLGKFRSLWRV